MGGLRSDARDALYTFGREHVRPSLLRRDEEGRFDRELWQHLADQGLFSSALRGEAGVLEAAQALAGLAHGGLDAPLALAAAAHWIGACLLRRFGDPDQQARYLGRIATGEWIAAVCNSEPEAGTRLRGMRSSVSLRTPGGSDELTLNKQGASNLGAADVAIFSAWKQDPERPAPGLEVFVLPTVSPLVQRSHAAELAGFRTGLTGALTSPGAVPIRAAEAQLGPDGSGPQILRLCFHLERLLIGALLQGLTDGLVDACSQHLREREARDAGFTQHQYVQEKLTLVYTLARRIEGLWRLVEDTLRAEAEPDAAARLERASPLLGALKLTAVEDSLLAATTAYELLGYAGYQRGSVVQKAHRDLLAFKMLGGTKELMKISVFRDLLQPSKRS